MRRNNNMGPRGPQVRRGPVWEHQQSPMNQGGRVNDQVQLGDLDMEIELLRRKRQLIQDQQQLLANERRFSNHAQHDNPMYGYDCQRFDEPSSYGAGARNFSQLYDDRPANVNVSRFSRPSMPGRKRQSDSKFSQPAQKRFSQPAPRNIAPKPTYGSGSNFNPPTRGSLSKPKSGGVAPKKGIVRPAATSAAPRRPPPRQTGPSSGKITKPRPPQAPNKLNSYPTQQRKALVSEASKDFTYILKEDEEPNKHVTGRLEFALGKVMGELRKEYSSNPEYQVLFNAHNFMRPMKMMIRQRIRECMLNKAVGQVHQIMEIYRQKFPKETDKEIIDYALEAGRAAKHMELDKSGNPEEFFKKNMEHLLKLRLNAMFATLKKTYERNEITEVIDAAIERLSSTLDETALNSTIGSDCKDDSTTNNLLDQSNVADASNGKTENPEMAKKEQEEPATSTADETSMQTDAIVDNATEEIAKEIDTTDPVADENAKQNDAPATEESGTQKNTSVNEDIKQQNTSTNVPASRIRLKQRRYYEGLIEMLLKQHLPKVLPLYRDEIIKILDLDKQFNSTKAAVIWRAKLKAEGKMSVDGEVLEKDTNTPISANNYYVKVSGRPSLPKKPIMRKFLSQFKPVNIKKHKMIPNLLFVGFKTKDDYNKILANHGKTVASCTLSIKPSANQQSKNESSDKDSKEDAIEISNQEAQENKTTEGLTEAGTQNNQLTKTENDQEIQNDEQDCLNESLNEQKDDLLTVNEGSQMDTCAPKTNLETVMEIGEPEKKQDTENAQAETTENGDENKNGNNEDVAGNDQVEAVKNEEKGGRPATPTRSSNRLAKTATSTPLNVKTRRASRVSQNN